MFNNLFNNISQSITNFQFKKAMMLAPLPIFFWAWVLCITFWIESTTVHTVPTEVTQVSQIDFTGIHYMQGGQNDAQVIMNAPTASYSSENDEFIVDMPTLTWQKASDSQIISVSAIKGNFYAEQTASDLPSAFKSIILSGSATLSTDEVRIDSETMIFDNDTRFFIFPGSFTFYKDKSTSYPLNKMYFDPIAEKCNPISQLLKDNPNIMEILKKGGFNQP